MSSQTLSPMVLRFGASAVVVVWIVVGISFVTVVGTAGFPGVGTFVVAVVVTVVGTISFSGGVGSFGCTPKSKSR